MEISYNELERVFHQFPMYHMKIMLGEFKVKLGRHDMFKPALGKVSSYEISNDTADGAVKLKRKQSHKVRS
jgi:hypothetical protein